MRPCLVPLVLAVASGCTSPFLNEVPEIPAPTGECIPNLGVTALTATVELDRIVLSFQAEADAGARFRLERRPEGESWEIAATLGAAELPFVETDAACAGPDQICGFRVNRVGACADVEPLAITVRSLPHPVTDLGAATELTSGNQVQLSWSDANAYESGYQIERQDPGATTFAVVGTRAGTASLDNATFSDPTPLTLDRVYHYRVIPFVDNGPSGVSFAAPSDETAAYTAPLAPTDLTVAPDAAGTLLITWTDASQTESGFELERSDDGGTTFASVLAEPLPADSSEYTDTGLADDTAYAYRLRAINALADPTLTSAWATAGGTTSPAGPSSLAAVTTPPTTVDLTWSDTITGEAGYVVERSLVGGAGFVAEQTENLPADSEALQITGLLLDTRYFFRVYATMPGGGATGYAAVSAWTRPHAPTGVAGAAQSPTELAVSWTDESTIESGYLVERAPDAATFTLLTATPLPADTEGYSDTTADLDQLYTYRVSAVQAAATTPSGTLTSLPATGVGYSPPRPPASLQAAPQGASVALSWSDPNSHETGYRVDRGSGSPLNFATLDDTLPADSEAFVDATVAPETVYVYRVYALNATPAPALTSEPAEVSFSTVPAAPTGLTATTQSHTSIQLDWTDQSTVETGYRLERLDGTMTVLETFDLAADTITYTDSNATAGNTYTYRLAARNAAGASASVTTPGYAPALPAPSWGAAPTLGASCNLTVPGAPGIDSARTALFSLADGSVSGSTGLVAAETGLSATLTTLDTPVIATSWTVQDTYAGQGTIARTLLLRVAAAAPAVFTTSVAPPAAVGGDDAMVGRQVFFVDPAPPGSGCIACNGLRGSLAAGEAFSCALTHPGGAACWGENGAGQLGNGLTTAGANGWTPVCETGSGASCSGGAPLTSITALAAGASHTCATDSSGHLWCWGDGTTGALGDGLSASRSLPAPVCASGSGAGCSALLGWGPSAGDGFGCAITAVSETRCWGTNDLGQLGDGTADATHLLPTLVCASGSWDGSSCSGGAALDSVVALASGAAHTCAIISGGGVQCWGAGQSGQLGDGNSLGTITARGSGAPVCTGGAWNGTDCGAGTPLGGIVALALGATHSCALTSGGQAVCWGENTFDQLGRGATSAGDALPGDVCDTGVWDGSSCAGGGPLGGILALAAGERHTCALLTGGAVRCWGDDSGDQLGGGGTPTDAIAIAAGARHTCALRRGGGVSCWGENTVNQIGDNLGGAGVTVDTATPVCTAGSAGTCAAFDRAARRGCGPLEVLQ